MLAEFSSSRPPRHYPRTRRFGLGPLPWLTPGLHLDGSHLAVDLRARRRQGERWLRVPPLLGQMGQDDATMPVATEAESSWASFTFSLSLQVRHPRRSTASVSTAVGLRPGRAWVAGDARMTSTGTRLVGVYKESYCFYDLAKGTGPEALEAGLQAATRALAKHASVLRAWRRSGGRLSYYLAVRGTGVMGFSVNPELLSEIADVGIALGVEAIWDRRRTRRVRRADE